VTMRKLKGERIENLVHSVVELFLDCAGLSIEGFSEEATSYQSKLSQAEDRNALLTEFFRVRSLFSATVGDEIVRRHNEEFQCKDSFPASTALLN